MKTQTWEYINGIHRNEVLVKFCMYWRLVALRCKAIALEEGQTGCEILYVLEAGCIAFGFLHELEAKVSRKPQNHKHLSLEAFPTLKLKGEH